MGNERLNVLRDTRTREVRFLPDAERAFRLQRRSDRLFAVFFTALVMVAAVVIVLAIVGGVLLIRLGLGLLAKGGF